ncbi:DUF4352 domain-containing protein [Listeria booriae]|uniref:DUF4352 domain-containing protein n=1 Tax=Listeria booriae TaxID=1552123 RepID=A0A7X0XKQ1_9LIST|nr:DUF4352 domain-containing protein [Listeria booriae]MBC1559588.1 DUF4352 domain-containing protein [Listeria booriae]MBC1562849.1 DUF4352 domain-containing protein [Listeria booriae]MBC1574879.1 DUF4352 domain-containing protein [Listeria booriae]MBC2036926.1 DUF4352 domain-containing protein [Listeria booriae]MBC2180462.1 DUF4352 domain-containing protein [Listeria booriae]
MKRLTLGALVLIAAMFIAACGQTKDEVKDDRSAKTYQNIDFKVKHVTTTKKGNDGKKDLVRIEMAIENNDVAEVGVGGGDFKVKPNGGKEMEVAPGTANFGDMIKPGKILTGKITYEIPANTKSLQLLYQPDGKKTELSWELAVPKNK